MNPALDQLHSQGFDIQVRNHADAILSVDFPDQLAVLARILSLVSIPIAEIIGSGGGEAQSTQRLRRALADAGWPKHEFNVQITVDGVPRESVTHEIDHVFRAEVGTLALEIEWNNKDPFFDRDLENFQRLHAQSAISIGILVTRGQSLQNALFDLVAAALVSAGVTDEDAAVRTFEMKDRTARQRENVRKLMRPDRRRGNGMSFVDAFATAFVRDKFGTATTHWLKLMDRAARGVGAPCPLLLIGIPASVVTPYSAATAEL